ncbi:MAG: BlaI/MecI/CopY family transcriptional regulator [Lachnospiraceae bacterium]|nr:BlaI/MecI/CopY family transcriptional regulator [Lachnospiraceae bacterium]
MKNLSDRQLEVMNILWEQKGPMIASQILDADCELNINTVQCVLKGLIKKEYIEVASIVYSGTVLARSYQAVISKEEYLQNLYSECAGLSGSENALVALIKQEKDIKVLDELEKTISEVKERLKGRKL